MSYFIFIIKINIINLSIIIAINSDYLVFRNTSQVT